MLHTDDKLATIVFALQVVAFGFIGWLVVCVLSATFWYSVAAGGEHLLLREGLAEPVRQLQELVGGSEED